MGYKHMKKVDEYIDLVYKDICGDDEGINIIN
ncbi:hypothetical protein N071400001_14460 [Clostridium tetani]|nr:hypothetical protein K154306013_13820 [Clostridium tetani]BDR86838.1 hypothetical protein N071400001_14460 [Clostridium tetani]